MHRFRQTAEQLRSAKQSAFLMPTSHPTALPYRAGRQRVSCARSIRLRGRQLPWGCRWQMQNFHLYLQLRDLIGKAAYPPSETLNFICRKQILIEIVICLRICLFVQIGKQQIQPRLHFFGNSTYIAAFHISGSLQKLDLVLQLTILQLRLLLLGAGIVFSTV